MRKTELAKYQKMLEQKQLELSKRPDRDSIAVARNADVLDEIQYNSEREIMIRNLDRESEILRNVRSALGRIKDGSFGICPDCEEDISPKRLSALPWAERCVGCQEQVDRKPDSAEEAA